MNAPAKPKKLQPDEGFSVDPHFAAARPSAFQDHGRLAATR